MSKQAGGGQDAGRGHNLGKGTFLTVSNVMLSNKTGGESQGKKSRDSISRVKSLKKLGVEGWQVFNFPSLIKEKITSFSSTFDYPTSYMHLISQVWVF